jgi:hypothetical protein
VPWAETGLAQIPARLDSFHQNRGGAPGRLAGGDAARASERQYEEVGGLVLQRLRCAVNPFRREGEEEAHH